jgi:hypothetical protein
MPTALELLGIIHAFNSVETDPQVEVDVWKSDDVLGWLYESYNNFKKSEHKLSGNKTEYHKVSIQSQVYTPRWVLQFLVDNSLGKLYLEMYPNSEIRHRYKIANAPHSQSREIKPLHEIKMIDPSTGSGNFLLYGFDLFYDLYIDQIENYGAEYNERDIPKLIVENNLYGVDLDDRAIQLAQLGLYIKAKRKKRTAKVDNFNIVSSDFYLPAYDQVKDIFEGGQLGEREKRIIEEVWADLQNAHKFGTLVRIDEKITSRWFGDKSKKNPNQIDFFEDETKSGFESFREEFFNNLQEAVAKYAERQGETFLSTKTQDAFTFLRIISQQYQVVVANPPYTDSADFGPELKEYIETNYKLLDYKFHTNLYSSFIKRSSELLANNGKIAMIHPLTFMYIKSFEDVRKFILDNFNISVLVEFGMGGLFPQHIFVDPAFYILEKSDKKTKSLFFSLDQYSNTNKQSLKKTFLYDAITDIINGVQNNHVFSIEQDKLKIIKGQPFIYWISDSFRSKFKGLLVKDIIDNKQGLATTNNNKYLRFWWEISEIFNYSNKWYLYAKGGPFNRWYGNLWCVVNFENAGFEIKSEVKMRYPYLKGKTEFVVKNEDFYFREGITYSASGGKGPSYRYLPKNSIFDVGGSGIFPTYEFKNLEYILALFNSSLISYIVNCLNPTVNTQAGDIERVPFVLPDKTDEDKVSALSRRNIEIKRRLTSFNIFEINYFHNALEEFKDSNILSRVISYCNYENQLNTIVLLNQAILDEIFFKVYNLENHDIRQVRTKMGHSVGSLPVLEEARKMFISNIADENKDIVDYINHLPEINYSDLEKAELHKNMLALYQTNNNIDDFCIKNNINPINVCYLFNHFNLKPQIKIKEIVLEFLVDNTRLILRDDEDGIIPLANLPGEISLGQRMENQLVARGLSSAQILQIESLIGTDLECYFRENFFTDLSNCLNLFRFLPKTPFIWHLTSGEFNGFAAYISIYKWNRDSLFKLKTRYINKRIENLEYRQIQLQGVTSAQAQAEKELIRHQLDEIQVFLSKIDELIAEGYDPKLDDGVAKNIAPLQKKGMLRAEVLKTAGGKKSQLEKYLNADW